MIYKLLKMWKINNGYTRGISHKDEIELLARRTYKASKCLINSCAVSFSCEELLPENAFASSPSSFASIGPFLEELRHIGELTQWPLLRPDERVACSQQKREPGARFCRCHHHWKWSGRPWACEQRGLWTSGWSWLSTTRSYPTSSPPCRPPPAPFSDRKARQQLIQFPPAIIMHKWPEIPVNHLPLLEIVKWEEQLCSKRALAGIDYFAETVKKGETFPKNPEKTSMGHLVDEVQAAGAVDIAFAGGNLS